MEVLKPAEWEFLMCLARRIVPESSQLDPAGEAEFRAVITGALGARPAAVRRQIGILLKILRWAPVLRYGRPLDRLSPAKQIAALSWFQDGPVTLLRKGFWGLKAMVFMGYYGRAAGAQAVGWTPSLDGNAELEREAGR
jgi:hypothetical protein